MSRQSRLLVSALFVSCLSACNKPSADPTSSAALFDATFVQAFIGHCVQAFPDASKIEAAATAMRWKRITDPATLRMIGPVNEGSDWKAWGFKSDGKGFMLATGQNDANGQPARFCVLMSEPSNIDATRNQLVELLRAKRLDAREEGGQRYEIYQFEYDGRPMLLNFIDGSPMGMKMLNASAMVLPRP